MRKVMEGKAFKIANVYDADVYTNPRKVKP